MNKVILTGRVSKISKPKQYEKGNLIKFDLAVLNEKHSNSNSNDEFIEITLFDSMATNFAKYIDIGDMVEISGKLKINSYTNKDNQKIKQVEVYADSVLYSLKSLKNKEQKQPKENQISNFEFDYEEIKQ